MASPKASHLTSQGFTLVEIIVVLSVLVMVGVFTIAIGLDSFRVSALGSEQRMLISVLQKARAESLNNINEKPHGVAIFLDRYVIFEGNSYAAADHASDEVLRSTYDVQISSLPALSPFEIVFTQLSATTNFEGDITLFDDSRSATRTISINHEGAISW